MAKGGETGRHQWAPRTWPWRWAHALAPSLHPVLPAAFLRWHSAVGHPEHVPPTGRGAHLSLLMGRWTAWTAWTLGAMSHDTGWLKQGSGRPQCCNQPHPQDARNTSPQGLLARGSHWCPHSARVRPLTDPLIASSLTQSVSCPSTWCVCWTLGGARCPPTERGVMARTLP